MILNLVLWYLVTALAGWLVFPLAYRLLSFLPDRGLAFSRPFGLLLWGYAYWILVSFGLLQNDPGGVLLALLVVSGLSLWRLRNGGYQEVRAWLHEHRGLVLVTELLFLAMFAFYALIRAAAPDASGTEKPMELAFINAILRSPAFPPADPWLSGYAISYYYFGYIMVAMLARLSGVAGSVAFNLALATWFALTGLAAYGLLYNLLMARGRQIGAYTRSLFAPLLAPLFVLIVSNLEGFLEMLHAGGLFWRTTTSTGQGQSAFWQWLNIQELTAPPSPPLNWVPNRPSGIWWWRASRVLQDFDLGGNSREIIDEFPMFSFILGDLHPHVLSMPFVLLALGFAFNMYLKLRESGAVLRLRDWVRTQEFWFIALALGGLSFLNTWDFPIYLALFAAAVTLARLAWIGWNWDLVTTFLKVLGSLGIAGGVLYLPFYLGFASQANGILPSLVFFTRGTYFWIMFGTLLLPILAWLIWLVVQERRSGSVPALGQGLLVAAALIGGLWLVSTLLGLRILLGDPSIAGIWGASPGAPLLQQSFIRRLQSPGTWLSLLGLLALTWGLIQSFRCRAADELLQGTSSAAQENSTVQHTDPFVLLLVLLGTGLVLFPEFFYLRDQFGWRMNTIFKFYFQAWIVWAIAAAYASVMLWRAWNKAARAIPLELAWVVLLAMALAYPLFGIRGKLSGLNPAALTLDGADYMARYNPEEMAGIRWLQQAPYGTLVEAVGGSYTGFARVSMLTGLPSVLGWPGHESQWRGGAEEMGSRENDIAQLYHARTWDQANAVLTKYNIRYIYLGSLEKQTYKPNETLFKQHLKSVFSNEIVTIFEVPRLDLEQGQAVQP